MEVSSAMLSTAKVVINTRLSSPLPLNPLDAEHFPVAPAVENHGRVRNPTPNCHGITGYLSDPTVARRIHAALVE